MAGIVVAAAVLVDARIAAIDVAVDVLVGCRGAIVAGGLRVWRAIIGRKVSRAISTAGAAGRVVGPSVVPSV